MMDSRDWIDYRQNVLGDMAWIGLDNPRCITRIDSSFRVTLFRYGTGIGDGSDTNP